MNESRFTFLEPTNFNVPITVFNTLVDDAYYFGYVKNNQANLSGLLNHLIPNLTKYRNDLHFSFLNNTKGDEVLTRKIEENIYKIYFSKYDYCDDGIATIPFRANKEHLQEFLDIVDNVIYNFDMDFTGYVRSLLVEYSSKRLNQREYFFYYNEIEYLKNAIKENKNCHFYTSCEKSVFVPISIELSKNTERNLIVGFNVDNQRAYVLPLSYIKRIVVTDKSYELLDDFCEFTYYTLSNFEKEQEAQE